MHQKIPISFNQVLQKIDMSNFEETENNTIYAQVTFENNDMFDLSYRFLSVVCFILIFIN
jgi:hypothetical protein